MKLPKPKKIYPKIFFGKRASGKTKMLIEWAISDPDNRAIVVADERRRKDILHRVKHMGWSVRIYIIDEIWSSRTARGTQYGFDDIDDCLRNILPYDSMLGPLTMTATEPLYTDDKARFDELLNKQLDGLISKMEETVEEIGSWK